MRIVSAIDGFGVGGAEMALVALVESLPEHQHVVVHCSGVNDVAVYPPFLRRLRAAGVPVFDVHWRLFRVPVARATLFDGLVPDVVLCHWWGGDPWSPWRRDLAEARVFGSTDPSARPIFVCVLHTAERAAPTDFDRYVLVADSQRWQVADVPDDRVVRIPNGIDTTRFRPGRPRRRAAGDPFVIGRLARLDHGKTPVDLVATAVGWAVPGARWDLVGDGTLATRIAADVARLPDPAMFTLRGTLPRSRVPAYLRSLDVLFHITGAFSEAHPLALMEALACGVPVVAERRGGVPEIVTHDVDGLLGADPTEVGAHLRRLAVDRALLARLAAGARAAGPRFALGLQLVHWRALLASG